MARGSCRWTPIAFTIQYSVFVSLFCFALSVHVSRFVRKTDELIPYTEEETAASGLSRFECLAKCGESDTCLGVARMNSYCRMYEFDRGADPTSVMYYNVSTDPSHITWVSSRLEDLNMDPNEGKRQTQNNCYCLITLLLIFKLLKDISSFRRSLVPLFLDIWWCLPWVTKPEWVALFTFWSRLMCYTLPKSHLWSYTCRPLEASLLQSKSPDRLLPTGMKFTWIKTISMHASSQSNWTIRAGVTCCVDAPFSADAVPKLCVQRTPPTLASTLGSSSTLQPWNFPPLSPIS